MKGETEIVQPTINESLIGKLIKPNNDTNTAPFTINDVIRIVTEAING